MHILLVFALLTFFSLSVLIFILYFCFEREERQKKVHEVGWIGRCGRSGMNCRKRKNIIKIYHMKNLNKILQRKKKESVLRGPGNSKSKVALLRNLCISYCLLVSALKVCPYCILE